SAHAERGQEKIVRRRPGVSPAESHRFIAFETMRTDLNFLGKPSRAAADDHVRGTVRGVGCHRWEQQSNNAAKFTASLQFRLTSHRRRSGFSAQEAPPEDCYPLTVNAASSPLRKRAGEM